MTFLVHYLIIFILKGGNIYYPFIVFYMLVPQIETIRRLILFAKIGSYIKSMTSFAFNGRWFQLN